MPTTSKTPQPLKKMATSTLLINQTQFEEKTRNKLAWSNPDFQATLLAMHETTLQDEFDTCMTALQTRTESETLTAADTALLGYMRPYIAYKALAEYVYVSSVEIGAGGAGREIADSWEPASAANRNMAAKQLENRAQQYRVKLMEFLAENASDYPCYVESTKANQLADFFRDVHSTGTDYIGSYNQDDIYPYADKRLR